MTANLEKDQGTKSDFESLENALEGLFDKTLFEICDPSSLPPPNSKKKPSKTLVLRWNLRGRIEGELISAAWDKASPDVRRKMAETGTIAKDLTFRLGPHSNHSLNVIYPTYLKNSNISSRVIYGLI